jgi:hypothetical protein
MSHPSVEVSHLDFDWAFPVALGTFHDSCRYCPEINVFQADDVSTARANMSAFPLSVLDRIGRWHIHDLLAYNFDERWSRAASVCLRRGANLHVFPPYLSNPFLMSTKANPSDCRPERRWQVDAAGCAGWRWLANRTPTPATWLYASARVWGM